MIPPSTFVAAIALARRVVAGGGSLYIEPDGCIAGLLRDEDTADVRTFLTVDTASPWARYVDTYRALRLVLLCESPANQTLAYAVDGIRLLAGPVTIELHPDARPGRAVYVTTHKGTWESLNASREVVFLARELEAAAWAAELGRASPRDWDAWVERKARGRGWTLTPDASGATAVKASKGPTCCLGGALDALGLKLGKVVFHGE